MESGREMSGVKIKEDLGLLAQAETRAHPDSAKSENLRAESMPSQDPQLRFCPEGVGRCGESQPSRFFY